MAARTHQAARTAAIQHGVLTREQALEAGFTERQLLYRLKLKLWKELYPRVYRVAGSASTWEQELTAASLWAEREYAFSHRCAAALWGFDRFSKEVVELSTTRNLRTVRSTTVHVVSELSDTDIGFKHGFRVTTATRTLIDLAEGEAFKDLRASVDQALRRKWTTLADLEVGLRVSRRGTRKLRALVEYYRNGGKPAESELEARVLELFEESGLPWPVKQEQINVDSQNCRVDFYVPGTRLIVEADGHEFHSGEAYETDRIRDIVLESNGYIVQRWTWRSIIEQPALLLEAARRIIALGPRHEDLVAAPR